MLLSIAQIQAYMRQAGWPDDLIVTGSAVFYYESARGNTTAHKTDSLERSYGLAQINLGLPGSRLANERASLGPAERLYDPLYNLQIALQLFYQQGWHAWQNTYYGGRYKQFLPQAQLAYNAGAGASDNADNSASDNLDFFGIESLADVFSDAAGKQQSNVTTTPSITTSPATIAIAIAAGLGGIALLGVLISDN